MHFNLKIKVPNIRNKEKDNLREFFAYPLEGVAMLLLWVNSLLFKYEYEISKYGEDKEESNKN